MTKDGSIKKLVALSIPMLIIKKLLNLLRKNLCLLMCLGKLKINFLTLRRWLKEQKACLKMKLIWKLKIKLKKFKVKKIKVSLRFRVILLIGNHQDSMMLVLKILDLAGLKTILHEKVQLVNCKGNLLLSQMTQNLGLVFRVIYLILILVAI